MKTLSLYNNDGTLSTEAQFLLAPKPELFTQKKWRKKIKNFKNQLVEADLKEFIRLKKNRQGLHWRQNNLEKARAQQRDRQIKWAKSKPERVKEVQAKSYAKNSEKAKLRTYSWIQRHPDQHKQTRRQYEALRRKEGDYRFLHALRSASNRVVKQLSLGKKPTSSFKWVGCSPEELKAYFESLFIEGMSWDNYGEWHVDHIRPVSSFKPEEWEQINHYTNLQPLWAKDNLSKSNKI